MNVIDIAIDNNTYDDIINSIEKMLYLTVDVWKDKLSPLIEKMYDEDPFIRIKRGMSDTYSVFWVSDIKILSGRVIEKDEDKDYYILRLVGLSTVV